MSDDAGERLSDARERLRELGQRIERLAIAPSELRRQRPWLRVTSPFYKLLRWRPTIRTNALRALLDLLREGDVQVPVRARLPGALAVALDELSENVAAAERASVMGAAADGPLAGWLTRLHEIAARAAHSVLAPDDRARRSVALALDAEWALSPLAVRSPAAGGAGAGAAEPPDAASAGDGEGADTAGSSDEGEDPRLVELELAAIDRVLDAARAETHFLGRRRRLFEAARKLLLDASAALPLDQEAVHARAQHIADEIVLVNRWEAAGVAPDIALPHQALSAMSRGERQKLYATLRATATIAAGQGSAGVVARAAEALRRLDGRAPAASASASAAADAEAERSAGEMLGEAAVHAVRDAYEAARRELAFRKLAPPGPDEDAGERAQRIDLWGRYLHDDAVLATLSAAVSVDGCFEVGGTLAPMRVEEMTRRVNVVSYPTQDLVLVPARDAGDLPNAVIEDPRAVVLALAQGRLLARKFVRVDTVRTQRTRLQSEARIYVLDGSDSMLMGKGGRAAGARARMRDAILLAELSTLYRRAAARGGGTRVVLFYRYFTKVLGSVVRVGTADEAVRAMAEVVGTPRHGGTDIEAALIASFEQIREARASDPDLARAQVVLVTDGEAWVDEAKVQAAREGAGDLPIGVSVIALGEENPVLRRLVARQRARGEPAFYHFVSDVDLAALVEGRRAAGAAVHLSDAPADGGASAQERAAALAAELGSLVDEIDAIERARGEGRAPAGAAGDGMGSADADALAALGLPHHETEGERAHREARERDERALALRFDAWFPGAGGGAHAPAGGGAEAQVEADVEPGDVDAVAVVLATLADVLADLGGTPAERRADAIELLERLLPDARLSPARYRAVVRARPPAVARALAAIRGGARS